MDIGQFRFQSYMLLQLVLGFIRCCIEELLLVTDIPLGYPWRSRLAKALILASEQRVASMLISPLTTFVQLLICYHLNITIT